MLTDAQIADVKARADLRAIAEQLGAKLRKTARGFTGSCPICGGGVRAQRFEIKNGGKDWVCAVCEEGGDAIRLVALATGRDFRSAVEYLGGARVLSEAEERKIAERRKREEERRAREAESYRRRAIEGARRIWEQALCDRRERVYFSARGVLVPASAMIRFAPDLPYFEGEEVDELGRASPRIIHRGPAIVAAILDNDDQFIGAHLTYLRADLAAKIKLTDPASGEELPAKKVRGASRGGHIVLRACPNPERLTIGEGIETSLSDGTFRVRTKRLRASDAIWSSVDLSNLGGPAEGTIAHPTLKNEKTGRPIRVPSAVPAEGPAIKIPASVRFLVMLGDGDSEPFLTRTTLDRGRARYAREGLKIRAPIAEEGKDFNDMWRDEEKEGPPA